MNSAFKPTITHLRRVVFDTAGDHAGRVAALRLQKVCERRRRNRTAPGPYQTRRRRADAVSVRVLLVPVILVDYCKKACEFSVAAAVCKSIMSCLSTKDGLGAQRTLILGITILNNA